MVGTCSIFYTILEESPDLCRGHLNIWVRLKHWPVRSGKRYFMAYVIIATSLAIFYPSELTLIIGYPPLHGYFQTS
jgi:hypothetical protein